MTLTSSPDRPQPLARIVGAVADWVGRLGEIWVEAQVIEIKRRAAPTQFLTLRDRFADVSCSVTTSAFVLDSAGSLPEGSQVRARLKPRVWEPNASLSFECLELQVAGTGRLLAELDARRRTLQAEGLFDAHRKKRLPLLPRRIGLITGKDSDAEHDVLRNVSRRWPARFTVAHSLVQGPTAAASVMQALHSLDDDPEVDVIVIARGGGALEDLLPFSDEGLVRAVSACRTPVVSAIGHESDTPLLDFVADLRASTPTDAASPPSRISSPPPGPVSPRPSRPGSARPRRNSRSCGGVPSWRAPPPRWRGTATAWRCCATGSTAPSNASSPAGKPSWRPSCPPSGRYPPPPRCNAATRC